MVVPGVAGDGRTPASLQRKDYAVYSSCQTTAIVFPICGWMQEVVITKKQYCARMNLRLGAPTRWHPPKE
jgi:hypothetical protein